LSVTGSSIAFKGEVSASYISSSRIQGLGIVSDFSSSVASQFYTNTQLVNSFTQSITDLNNFSSSAIISIDNLQIFTASAGISLTNLNSFTASNGNTSLNSKTGSYATTGSNSFTGSQMITGSVYGNIIALSITSQTASMDLSTSNLFTLTLVSGSATRLQPSNIKAGQTINLKVLQPSVGVGTIVIPSTILQPIGNTYSATPSASAQDIVTLISFGTTLYASSIKNLA
jgi:hypothetical protein